MDKPSSKWSLPLVAYPTDEDYNNWTLDQLLRESINRGIKLAQNKSKQVRIEALKKYDAEKKRPILPKFPILISPQKRLIQPKPIQKKIKVEMDDLERLKILNTEIEKSTQKLEMLKQKPDKDKNDMDDIQDCLKDLEFYRLQKERIRQGK
ncbi:hypothetical protein HK103_002048 [Boothiomyces macroporosus]|uniref:Uncharacterized protein n=1 Tax=Boothiomyces macroporosus TaxID=261099 RepID=A0AAD5UDL1_9FUNG|nr:hypothetical protein HK103_002048 [Boothiomyces macroporosus]